MLTSFLPLAEPAHSPALFPLVSCQGCDEDHVTFGCLASGFFPGPAQLSWEGVASEESQNFPEVQIGAGSYGLSSRVTVGVAKAKEGHFLCLVEHRGGAFQRNITGDDICPEEPNFSVSLLSSPNQSELADDVTLLCQVRGSGSADASLTWLVNGDVTELEAELSTCEEGGAGQVTLNGRANVSRELWDAGATFTCRAGHAQLATPREASISTFCKAPEPTPSVLLLPPSLQDLYLSATPNLTCVATALKSPEAKFTWSRQGGGALGVATSGPAQKLPSGLFELRSFLGICAEDWNSGDAFTCSVLIPEVGTTPLSRSVKKESGSAVPPKVVAFPPSPEELSLAESATLTCVVTGFYPRDLLLTWTQQDSPVEPQKFSVLGPAPEEGSGRFWAASKLEVAAEEWRRGDVFACVVGHDGLGLRFTQRSLDKSSARPANVNVSVVLADSDVVCY